MKAIIFDAGPLISLTTNNLLWLLEELKKRYPGNFVIPKSVKEELVDKPLQTKRYKFEALQILPLITNKTLTVISTPSLEQQAKRLLTVANTCYYAKGTPIQVVQLGEMEALALHQIIDAQAFVLDERITRMLIEEPMQLAKRLSEKLHTPVQVQHEQLATFKQQTKNVKIIRSGELVTVAYELGLLDKYMGSEQEGYVKNIQHEVIEGVLWGIKLQGCAISEEEINELIKLQKTYRRKKE
ncbi:MAG: hypothetical protein QW594_04660 [Candidatus Woesearchaeota archaeon]